jgi:hypothetical protein
MPSIDEIIAAINSGPFGSSERSKIMPDTTTELLDGIEKGLADNEISIAAIETLLARHGEVAAINPTRLQAALQKINQHRDRLSGILAKYPLP